MIEKVRLKRSIVPREEAMVVAWGVEVGVACGVQGTPGAVDCEAEALADDDSLGELDIDLDDVLVRVFEREMEVDGVGVFDRDSDGVRVGERVGVRVCDGDAGRVLEADATERNEGDAA